MAIWELGKGGRFESLTQIASRVVCKRERELDWRVLT